KSARFGVAAEELVHRGAECGTRLHATIRRSKINLRTIVGIESVTTTSRLARIKSRSEAIVETGSMTLKSYRSRRAALVAHYGSKIAQALHHLPSEEIDAAIAALRFECDAALENLKIASRVQGVRRRKRRRVQGLIKAHPHVRFRARTRLRPR